MTNQVNMDELLDGSLDSLADMPEFYVPPKGAYIATIKSLEQKMIGENPALELSLVIASTEELEDPSEEEPKSGAEISQSFMMNSDFGQGKFKALMFGEEGLMESLGCATVRQLLEEAAGSEVLLVTSFRLDKADKTKKYLDIKSVTLL